LQQGIWSCLFRWRSVEDDIVLPERDLMMVVEENVTTSKPSEIPSSSGLLGTLM